jgi:hypothetical protein
MLASSTSSSGKCRRQEHGHVGIHTTEMMLASSPQHLQGNAKDKMSWGFTTEMLLASSTSGSSAGKYKRETCFFLGEKQRNNAEKKQQPIEVIPFISM